MNFDEFKAQVETIAANLIAISQGGAANFPATDYNLDACRAAAAITGADETTAKLFNRSFREAATRAAFEMAQVED